MKTRNIVMLVVLALLFVAAGVLVAVGVVTHDEPGFESPENSWGHVALRVGCRRHGGGMQGCEHVARATAVINLRLGFEMFAYQGADSHSMLDVYVELGVPQLVADEGDVPHANGYTLLTGSQGIYEQCTVTTSNTGTVELLQLTLEHELGCHCLGLAHDDYDASICRAVQSPTPDGAFPPRISDSDRALVRERYAP